MSQNTRLEGTEPGVTKRSHLAQGCLGWLYKNAALILVVLFVGGVVFSLARSAIYKIRPYERGLHLRGGKFIANSAALANACRNLSSCRNSSRP